MGDGSSPRGLGLVLRQEERELRPLPRRRLICPTTRWYDEPEMTARERLHHLIEELPDSDLPTAERVLVALNETSGPSYTLDEAPPDDEPDDDDFDGGLTEARAEAAAGKGMTSEELERRLGLR